MINLNDLTPAAPSGTQNIKWQQDGSGNVSANTPTSPTKQTVTSTAGVLTIDASLGNYIVVNLHENVTSIVINNSTDAQQITVLWIQDVTGGWTVVFPSSLVVVKGGTAPSTTASSFSQQAFSFNLADTTWRAIAAGVTGM